MTRTLTFLHTSPAHIATFDRLLAEIDPRIPGKHIVHESLLRDARAGGLTAELAQRIAETIAAAFGDGAAIVVCTCSTIGGCAEQAPRGTDRRVVRIDRAMAEQAVATGSRIIIAAALKSTLAPTRQLICDVADQLGKEVTLIELVCEEAWAHFERGDLIAYHTAIAACLRGAASAGDVVVLAQASMAGAAAYCSDLAIPILSSPRLGLEAAIQMYRTVV